MRLSVQKTCAEGRFLLYFPKKYVTMLYMHNVVSVRMP